MGKQNDDFLRTIITTVASLALLISLVAVIFNRDGQLTITAPVFGSVAAFAFGAHYFNTRNPKE